jgi:hypothetical protein
MRLVRIFIENSDVKAIGSKKYKECYLKKRSGGRHKVFLFNFHHLDSKCMCEKVWSLL